MAKSNFIPTIWAREVLMGLRKNMVALNFINRDYEGEITDKGDTVRIVSPGAINIGDYDGTDITIQALTDATLDLAIDQAKYFAFAVDDVLKAQAKPEMMASYLNEANYSLADAADRHIFSMALEADRANIVECTAALDADDIYVTMTEAKRLMGLANVPTQGRRCALSPNEVKLLENADILTRSTPQGDQVVANGFVGRVAGFDVYETNNLVEDVAVATSSPGDPLYRHLVFSHPMACTFADQISKVETTRIEKKFADLVKGLHVYGKKVTRPTGIVVIKNLIGTVPEPPPEG